MTTDTRVRILIAAAALFARKGFHGTSTREIAAAVDVRQPSLFHHFASKQAILAELLDRDLDPTLGRLRRLRASTPDPASALYAYLLEDIAELAVSPFDARGIYNDEVLEDPGLRPQRRKRRALHAEIRELVEEGIESGVFRSVDPAFARRAISGMVLDTIWAKESDDAGDLADRPRQLAEFVLRGLLRDPAAIEAVRQRALETGDR